MGSVMSEQPVFDFSEQTNVSRMPDLLAEPPAGEIDFGSGPRASVQLLIEDWDATNNTQTPFPTTGNIDYTLSILAVVMPLSATLVVLFLLLQRRKMAERLG